MSPRAGLSREAVVQAAAELADGFGLPLDFDESFHRQVRVFLAGLVS